MPILNIVTSTTGLVGVSPKWIYIATNDTLAQVTAAGYLNNAVQNGATFREDDMAMVSTKTTPSSTTTQVAILELSYSTTTGWSLVSTGGPGNVALPTVANYMIGSTNTLGALANIAGTIINNGSVQAGISGSAGTFVSFPSTAANGTLILSAVNAGGAFNTTISNGVMAQSTVYTLGDIGAASGGIAVSTTPCRIKFIAFPNAGASATIVITDPFITTSSVVVASFMFTTNVSTLLTATTGNGSLTIVCSAAPGSCQINYIVMK